MTLIFTDTNGRHYVVDTNKLEVNTSECDMSLLNNVLTITDHDD